MLLNRWRERSVLYRTGLLSFFKPNLEYQLPLYSLYIVDSAFFTKDYWLHLWPAEQTSVDEAQQLRLAWAWWRRTGCRFAKTTHELTQTSFITSATNKYADIDLDPLVLNYILNEAWLRGELDPMHRFPLDFDAPYLKPLLVAAADARASYDGWLHWTAHFKKQYRRLCCMVD